MATTLLLSAAGGLLCLYVGLSHRRLAERVGRSDTLLPELKDYPSVSIIRPIRGADAEVEENLRAALDVDYPGWWETIFVLDDRADPAYALVERAVMRHQAANLRGEASLLIAGTPPKRRTGKLNAMMIGLERAQGELVAFGDSDTRPSPALLRKLVAALLTTPKAGDAFSPVVARSRLSTVGDVAYALLFNAWYGPQAARAAARDRSLPFIMGQLMVFRRESLQAIGGLACAEGQLVDDMYIGGRVSAAGYRNIMAGERLAIITHGLQFGEFVDLFRRWLFFSRNGLPPAFTRPSWLQGLIFYGAVAIICLAAWSHHVGGALVSVIALIGLCVSQLRMQTLYSGQPIPGRYVWVPALLLLMAPVMLLSTLMNRQVGWRGRAYSVDLRARLA